MAEKFSKEIAEGLASNDKPGKVETDLGVAVLAKAMIGGKAVMTIAFPDLKEKWIALNGKIAPIAWPQEEVKGTIPTPAPAKAKATPVTKAAAPKVTPAKTLAKKEPVRLEAKPKEAPKPPDMVEQLGYHKEVETVDRNLYSNKVTCDNVLPDGKVCKSIRWIKNADVFQVHLCKPCARRERRRRRDKNRKTREKAVNASAQHAVIKAKPQVKPAPVAKQTTKPIAKGKKVA